MQLGAVGLFDDFTYLYKFSLSYMNYLILPMILLSFLTTVFSIEYKNDTIKYIWTVPISRNRYFISKLVYIFLIAILCMLFVFTTICFAGYFSRFRDGMTIGLVVRFFWLCMSSSIIVAMSVAPISIVTILSKGNGALTNLIGSIYIILSFFLMNYLQGISPLASAPHIIWYKNFEGVQNNPHIVHLLINVVLVFSVYVAASMKLLKKQDL